MSALRVKQAIDAQIAAPLAGKLPVASPTYNGIARNQAGSFPEPENAISTTASHTLGSATITVANGSQVNNGDTIHASFLPYQTYIVSGGGTNTLVMSRDADASGTGATVTIGNDRWDMDSTTVGDTAGYRRLYVGEAAKGRSTFMNRINGAGLDYQQVTAFSCENEFGGVGGWFGSRMSLENTGLNGIISLGTYCLVDEDPGSRHAWNRYEQSNLLAGTAPTGNSQFIQVESSLESYWPTVEIDPFNYNPAGSTRVYRIDSGIGTYAERGEPPPENISAYIDIVENGGKAAAGIVFGAGSLDETGGRQPTALALPKNYQLSWFSALGNASFSIVSTATSGNAYLGHSNDLLSLGGSNFAITKPEGVSKAIFFRTDNLSRWGLSCTSTAESGGNAGSDFGIARFDDDGNYISLPIAIRRSTGRVALVDVATGAKYVDNAAAIAGGLVAGDLYATSAGELRIVV